jgi:cobalamin biosynthesis Mg chelatase CobN
MKKTKIIILLFLGASCLCGSKVLATKGTSFPDSNDIQPMGGGGIPNISGNIDWPNSLQNQDTSTDTDMTTNPFIDQTSPTDNSTNPNNLNTTNASSDSNQTNGSNVSNPNSTINKNTPSAASDSSNSTGNNKTLNNSTSSANPTNLSNSSNYSSYNFGATPSQGNEQMQNASAQNTSVQNDENSNDSAINQNATQQPAISSSAFVWALIFGSIILLIATFVAWRLKRIPNE